MSILTLYLLGDSRSVILHQQQPSLVDLVDMKGSQIKREIKIITDQDVLNKFRESWSHHALARMYETVYSNRGEILERKEPFTVYLKISRDPTQIKRLEHEASFYVNDLLHAQGKYVPRFFGFYTGRGVDMQRMSCTVLEFVHGEGPVLEGEVLYEFNIFIHTHSSSSSIDPAACACCTRAEFMT